MGLKIARSEELTFSGAGLLKRLLTVANVTYQIFNSLSSLPSQNKISWDINRGVPVYRFFL